MHILNKGAIEEAMRRRGISSASELAARLNVHRNSIYNYLAGSPILPEVVEKLLSALSLSPTQAIIKKPIVGAHPAGQILPIVDELHRNFPQLSFFLFGSRARGDNHKYSDYDIGVYCVGGLDTDLFLRVVSLKEDLVEPTPYTVNLSNLNQADREFVQAIDSDIVLLAGSVSDLLNLRRAISE